MSAMSRDCIKIAAYADHIQYVLENLPEINLGRECVMPVTENMVLACLLADIVGTARKIQGGVA